MKSVQFLTAVAARPISAGQKIGNADGRRLIFQLAGTRCHTFDARKKNIGGESDHCHEQTNEMMSRLRTESSSIRAVFFEKWHESLVSKEKRKKENQVSGSINYNSA